MAYNSGFDPTNPEDPQPYDPNQDPYLDLTNPTAGNRGSGAPTNSPYSATNALTPGTSDGGYETPPPDTGEYPGPGPGGGQLPPAPPQQGDPSTGGFIVPPGSLPPPRVTPPGQPSAGQTDNSFDSYSSDPTVVAIQVALQQGMQGDNLINFVKQRYPNAILRWDAQRGNVDLDLGGGRGLQFDQNAAGVWGVHPYDDGEGGSGGTSSGNTTASGTGGADIQALLAQLLGGQDQGRQNQFFDQIQGMIGQYGQPVTAQDPVIKGQVDAFSAAQQRGAQQGQAALAEQQAYRGIPTGTQDAGTAAGYEAAALNTGNFQASEIRQELTQRRNYLQQMFSLYGGQLSSEQARQLQAEIAAINATLSNQQMTNQNNQFYDQLGLTAAQQEAILNAQLIGAMSGG